MIVKKEFYRWEIIKLRKGKPCPHIYFITAWYFFGIPVYQYRKYVENKSYELDLEDDGGYIETVKKKTGVYDPNKDELRILEGEVEGSLV